MRFKGLFLLLFLRVLVGGFLSGECRTSEQVRIAGNIGSIDQKGSEKIIMVGHWRVVSDRFEDFKVGDKIAVIGSCRRGLIEFWRGENSLLEARIELLQKKAGKEKSLMAYMKKLREGVLERYQKQLPQPESGLLAGIVLGEKVGLGRQFSNALINSGTIHIAVASGYNVAVVGAAVMGVSLIWVKRRWASWLAVGAIVFYVLLAGATAPVVRAGIMGGLVLLAKSWGRQTRVLELLGLAVWAMVMVRPAVVEEISFQLSVAATWGLVVLEPRIRGLISFVGTPSALRASPSNLEGDKEGVLKFILNTEFTSTIAAQVVTAPIIWLYFGRVSWWGLLSNLLVLPLVPPVMFLGALQIFLGRLVAPLSYSLLHLMVVVIRLFD